MEHFFTSKERQNDRGVLPSNVVITIDIVCITMSIVIAIIFNQDVTYF